MHVTARIVSTYGRTETPYAYIRLTLGLRLIGVLHIARMVCLSSHGIGGTTNGFRYVLISRGVKWGENATLKPQKTQRDLYAIHVTDMHANAMIPVTDGHTEMPDAYIRLTLGLRQIGTEHVSNMVRVSSHGMN
jgi:hypothetical protein